jgi:lycopene cyclase domain-containing protein
MTYWLLNLLFLTAVAVVALAAMLSKREPRWRAVAITLVGVLIMTAIFDNVMISVGLVGYSESKITGVFVGVAPIEDFAYAVAAVVLLPAIWTLRGKPRA